MNLAGVFGCFLVGLVIGRDWLSHSSCLPFVVLTADLLLQPHSLPAVPVCAGGAEKSFWQRHTSGLLGIQAGTCCCSQEPRTHCQELCGSGATEVTLGTG